MLDLAEIRARLPQPTPAVPRSSYTLATEWDVTRQTFGRSRHMLSDATDDDNVLLLIEVRSGNRVEWHCSPPGYDERDYASGTVLVEQGAVDSALDKAKQQTFAAWARWVSEDTGEPVPPELNPEEQDIADLLSEVDRLTAELAAAQAGPVVEWAGDGRNSVAQKGVFKLVVGPTGWELLLFPVGTRSSQSVTFGPETGPAGKAAAEAAYRRACGFPGR